jgi:hypothetical protein
MSVERVDEMVADYGRDVMLLVGGSLLSRAMPSSTASQRSSSGRVAAKGRA